MTQGLAGANRQSRCSVTRLGHDARRAGTQRCSPARQTGLPNDVLQRDSGDGFVRIIRHSGASPHQSFNAERSREAGPNAKRIS
jgi:hypothetical protein